jgi:type IV secretory pathway VirJ component
MATVLTEFSDSGNSRTSTLAGHTALKPRIVIQKRKVAVNDASSPEDIVSIVYGTTDAAGAILPAKVAFEVSLRRPVLGAPADVTAALAVLRDIVASDEFTAVTTTQNWLKP